MRSVFFNSLNDDREYDAANWVEYFADLISDGVWANPANSMMIYHAGGMSVRLGIGVCNIKGHKGYSDGLDVLTLDYGDALPRIDRVVARLNLSTREIQPAIIKGTPASAPVAPSIVRSGGIYDLCLAEISVVASASELTQLKITDTRANTSLCGFVTGLIQQIDTTDLFIQFYKALTDLVNQLGESDKVEVSLIDEQARADIGELEEDIAEHEATLKTNAPYKILTGSSGASAGSTSITFATAFETVPVVIVVPYSTATTAYRACTCHLSEISETGFKVKTYTVTGATSANVENTAIGFRWVAYGT